jgi:glutamate/tyrosine decarboxylase-like PLP-dependent enzyme
VEGDTVPAVPGRSLDAAESRASDRRYDVLDDAARLARQYLDGLQDRPVGARAGLGELRAVLARPLTDEGEDARVIVASLARDVDGGLIASGGPRYFGFVIGGSVPAALAADWLVSAWDQNGGGFVASPALSVVEEVAATWIRELLGVPASSGVGFVTGCQMAHFTCLAAARHAVRRDAGWDVEADGVHDAPRVRVLAGEYAHVTVRVACRLLGLGQDLVQVVPADDQGRMRPGALREALAAGTDGPTIVCAQAGEINTGAFDPVVDIAQICREHRAWLHIDGAFGLWAAASPRRRPLLEGAEQASSWATDGHKWLNVPYDCGIAVVADADAHRAAMTSTSAYIPSHAEDVPWGYDWTPEFSRRARGVTVYAALRELGRHGLADLVDRCCDHARLIANRLAAEPGVEIVNHVVLNQVLVRFGDDTLTKAVIEQVQRDGTCWLAGTTFRGRAMMRISIVGWQTTAADAHRSADAIITAARAARHATR